MIAIKPKARSLLKVHGGKSYLARRIIDLLPEHTAYFEPFAGGCSVLRNKPIAACEWISDRNELTAMAWRAVKCAPDWLAAILEGVTYSKETFVEAMDRLAEAKAPFDVSDAASYIVVNRMSRDGLGKDFAWSDRTRGGQPGEINAWSNMIAALPELGLRMKDVVIIDGDFRDTIRSFLHTRDNPDSVMYCDPPYLPETRTARNSYGHYEMTFEDHLELLAILKRAKLRVVLSGYRSDLYDSCLKGWRCVSWDMPNHSAQGKTKARRTECVWLNW
jgi:DNA adenine methylase